MKNEMSAAIGEEIRLLREASGLTQTELGARLGIHRNTVIRYESGDDMPVLLFVRMIVELGGDVGEVMRRVL